MADRSANHGLDRSGVAPRDHARDHRGLIYIITGAILAAGILMMAFYDIDADRAKMPITQKPVVTAQK